MATLLGEKLAPIIHVQNNPYDKVNKYATNNIIHYILLLCVPNLLQFSGWAESSPPPQKI